MTLSNYVIVMLFFKENFKIWQFNLSSFYIRQITSLLVGVHSVHTDAHLFNTVLQISSPAFSINLLAYDEAPYAKLLVAGKCEITPQTWITRVTKENIDSALSLNIWENQSVIFIANPTDFLQSHQNSLPRKGWARYFIRGDLK